MDVPLSNDIPQPLRLALRSLIRDVNTATQVEVGSRLSTVFEQPTEPTLRLRVAHVAESLHEWHVSDANGTLSFLSTLLSETLTSTHMRDSAALAATLRTISSVANDTSISKEEMSRHAATLIPLIHAALFNSRPAHLDIYDSSATSATSDAGVPSHPTRVSPIRPHALSALHAVISAAPVAALPFWPLLIPTRAGVGSSAAPARRNVAFLLLYEADHALRASAAALTTTLVNSAKPILRHRRTYPNTSGATFAPSSERLLSGIIVLHSVLATALQTERVRTVVPRLSRLASDVLLSVNASAVPVSERVALLSALADVLLSSADIIDQTARAAAGSALASAFSVLNPKETYLEPGFLPSLSTRVITALTDDSSTNSSCPVVELLSVLRNIISLDTTLFLEAWNRLADFCRDCVTGSDHSVALHVTRLAETFISTVLSRMTPEHGSNRDDTDEAWAKQSVALSCEVYQYVLRHALKHEFHVVQSAAVVALDGLVQMTPVDSSDDGSDYVRSTAKAVGLVATPHDTVLEIADSLLEIVASPAPTNSVRAAAEKALGNLPVSAVGLPLCYKVLRTLQATVFACENEEDLIVLARGLAAFGGITEKVVQNGMVEKGESVQDILNTVMDVGEFAYRHLKTCNRTWSENQTASMRAVMDLSKVGAAQAAAGFMVSAAAHTVKSGLPSTAWRNLNQDIGVVFRDRFCDSNESVVVRCACGKAIGRIACSLSGAASVMITTGRGDETGTNDTIKNLCAVLESMIDRRDNPRVEAAAANALTDVMEKGGIPLLNCATLLKKCGQSLLWTKEQLRTLGLVNKTRGQYVHAQDCTTKLICVILRTQCSSQLMNDRDPDEETRHAIIEALCRFYTVPKFVTERLTDMRHEDAFKEVVLDSNPPVKLGDALSPEAKMTLLKALHLGRR